MIVDCRLGTCAAHSLKLWPHIGRRGAAAAPFQWRESAPLPLPLPVASASLMRKATPQRKKER